MKYGWLIFLCAYVWGEEPVHNLLSPADRVTLVDSISETELSTAPVTTPPPRVHLPLLIKKDEWRGVQCGVKQPRFALFRSKEKWDAFWTKGMAPFSARLNTIPPVDFETQMVMGVFLGEKPYPYEEVQMVRVVDVLETGEREVQYREIHKMAGVFTPPFAVQPFHLKRIPRDERPLRFKRVSR